MAKSKHSRANKAAAAKNREGRYKRRQRAEPPSKWDKKRATERAAQKADGIDPDVKPSTWLPTDARVIAEARNTRLARIVVSQPESDDETAVEAQVTKQTKVREDAS